MANVKLGTTELSTVGLAVTQLNGRALAAFSPEKESVLGRDTSADVSTRSDPGQTQLQGTLSADTNNWSNYTHAKMLERLDALKLLLDPELGFQKLYITGDRPTYYRWARYIDMDFSEAFPVFRRPFQTIGLTFENFERWWRVPHTNVTVNSVPTTVPNAGAKTRPIIEVNISGAIAATITSRIVPVTLFTIDGLSVQWAGITGDGALQNGDKLTLDSDTLTAIMTRSAVDSDVVRHYRFSGTDSPLEGGFPSLKKGGASVTAKHANVSSLVFRYDELYG